MSKVRYLIPFLAIIGIGVGFTKFAPPTLQVRMRPVGMVMAPGSCEVEVFVDRSFDNRQLDVILDGGDFYRSSTMTIDTLSPILFTYRYDRLPPGEYRAEVVLTQSIFGKWKEVRVKSEMLTVLN